MIGDVINKVKTGLRGSVVSSSNQPGGLGWRDT